MTKNIILHDFSLERWGFLKTYGMDPDSTGFKRLEWMICSWVCSASSSENEEVGVLVRFPIQCHRVKLRKLMCVEGHILFSYCKEFLSVENDDVGCL